MEDPRTLPLGWPAVLGIVVALAGMLAVAAPVAGASDNCGEALCDSSGNGHELSTNGDPIRRLSPEGKYQTGFDLDGHDDELETDFSRDLALEGNASLMAAFSIDTFPAEGTRVSIVGVYDPDIDGGNRLATIQVGAGGTVVYNDNGAVAQPIADERLPEPGFYTVTLRRVDNGNGTNDIDIHVYDAAGQEVADLAIEDRPHPTAGRDVGAVEAATWPPPHPDGGVYEIRVWDRPVEPEVLATIADPTAQGEAGYENAAEGTEEGLWFLGVPTHREVILQREQLVDAPVEGPRVATLEVGERDQGGDSLLCVTLHVEGGTSQELACVNEALLGPASHLIPRGSVPILATEPVAQETAIQVSYRYQPEALRLLGSAAGTPMWSPFSPSLEGVEEIKERGPLVPLEVALGEAGDDGFVDRQTVTIPYLGQVIAAGERTGTGAGP